MNEPAKNCPACAEEIKVAAKLCPYCRTKQVRFALWREELVIAGIVLIYIGAAAFLLSRLDPDSRIEGRLVWHGGDLTVGSVRVEPGGRDTDYQVTGMVTNAGGHPWRVHTLEARLVDADGKLRDAHHCSVDRPFVVLPGQTGDFRVSFRTSLAGVDGMQTLVRVQAATDGNAAFEDKQ